MIVAITLFASSCKEQLIKYSADWDSLEQADPVPEWFKDAKFGIYFHWGVYSVPAFGNEWYPRNMYEKGSRENLHHIENYGSPEEWPYHFFINGAEDKHGNFVQFAPKLKSEGGNFDPQEWAELFAASGARFACPVAEHHDDFSMWASNVNPWNAKEKGPGLDLVGLLVEAIREKDIKIILSMHHAFHGFYQTRRVDTPRRFFDQAPETEHHELQILYAQLSEEENENLWLGWPGDGEIFPVSTLSEEKISLENLVSVSLLGPEEGFYIPLEYYQDADALNLSLPEKPSEEMAYVIKLNFEGKIPELRQGNN